MDLIVVDTDKYITGSMHSVPGYMTQVDARIWQALCDAQTARGITGDLAEIGVYFGRSYFLLSLMKKSGEALWGCDIFTVTDNLLPGKDQRKTFSAHADRLGFADDATKVLKATSAALLDGAGEQNCNVRFMSIDGGHHLEDVRNDCAVMQAVLRDDGIVAFDDFCNPEWPEVTEGVFEFLTANPDYQLFAISRKKAYAAKTGLCDVYAEELCRALEPRLGALGTTRFRAADVLFVKEPGRAILGQKLNDRLKRGLVPAL